MCFAGNSNRIYQRLPEMAEHFGWTEKQLNNLDKHRQNILTGQTENKPPENIMSAVTPTTPV